MTTRQLIDSSVDPWEAAYLRFETPEEEIRKFIGRLRHLGATDWPKQARIVELFCGRGNGLRAWERLGYRNIEGVDLSPRLVAKYNGPARCYIADCRHLPFPNGSRDVAIVQGGLHHLQQLPEDLDQTCSEICRVLTHNGRVLFVEPWRTPFLTFVHFASGIKVVRRVSAKLDSLSTMVHYERDTYAQWLRHPELITSVVRRYFDVLRESVAWGKWNFVGQPRQ
jgi:SAM-dependent methyltransferase